MIRSDRARLKRMPRRSVIKDADGGQNSLIQGARILSFAMAWQATRQALAGELVFQSASLAETNGLGYKVSLHP
jgi:hypothetical protein